MKLHKTSYHGGFNQITCQNSPKNHLISHCYTSQLRSTRSTNQFRRHGSRIYATTDNQLITLQEVQDIARSRGLCISLSTLGPAYRIVCRDGDERGKIVAMTNGFIVPFAGLMHCDTLQIFTKGSTGQEGERVRGGVLGLGLLIGGATFAYGIQQGCTKAEILAINDDDAWHARLVSYYSRFGFKPVRVVEGGSLGDLPHMLVWGGAGTRMDADTAAMLKRWTPAIRQNSRKKQGENSNNNRGEGSEEGTY